MALFETEFEEAERSEVLIFGGPNFGRGQDR